MQKLKYTKDELAEAIVKLTDGNSLWYDIQDTTGLSREECKDLEVIVGHCIDYLLQKERAI